MKLEMQSSLHLANILKITYRKTKKLDVNELKNLYLIAHHVTDQFLVALMQQN